MSFRQRIQRRFQPFERFGFFNKARLEPGKKASPAPADDFSSTAPDPQPVSLAEAPGAAPLKEAVQNTVLEHAASIRKLEARLEALSEQAGVPVTLGQVLPSGTRARFLTGQDNPQFVDGTYVGYDVQGRPRFRDVAGTLRTGMVPLSSADASKSLLLSDAALSRLTQKVNPLEGLSDSQLKPAPLKVRLGIRRALEQKVNGHLTALDYIQEAVDRGWPVFTFGGSVRDAFRLEAKGASIEEIAQAVNDIDVTVGASPADIRKMAFEVLEKKAQAYRQALEQDPDDALAQENLEEVTQLIAQNAGIRSDSSAFRFFGVNLVGSPSSGIDLIPMAVEGNGADSHIFRNEDLRYVRGGETVIPKDSSRVYGPSLLMAAQAADFPQNALYYDLGAELQVKTPSADDRLRPVVDALECGVEHAIDNIVSWESVARQRREPLARDPLEDPSLAPRFVKFLARDAKSDRFTAELVTDKLANALSDPRLWSELAKGVSKNVSTREQADAKVNLIKDVIGVKLVALLDPKDTTRISFLKKLSQHDVERQRDFLKSRMMELNRSSTMMALSRMTEKLLEEEAAVSLGERALEQLGSQPPTQWQESWNFLQAVEALVADNPFQKRQFNLKVKGHIENLPQNASKSYVPFESPLGAYRMENLSREAFLEQWKGNFLFREPLTFEQKQALKAQLSQAFVDHQGDPDALDGLFSETVAPFLVSRTAIDQRLLEIRKGLEELQLPLPVEYLDENRGRIVEKIAERNLQHGFVFLRQLADGVDIAWTGLRPLETQLERLAESAQQGELGKQLHALSFPDKNPSRTDIEAMVSSLEAFVDWELGAHLEQKAEYKALEKEQAERIKRLRANVTRALLTHAETLP